MYLTLQNNPTKWFVCMVYYLMVLCVCSEKLPNFREVARMLANDYKKRVMIVDTSNEIGGDGDIPHAGIGSARRMQVPNSDMQHKV